MRKVKQCYGCKVQFRREELIDYAAPGTKTMHSYCAKCSGEKHAREAFANKVCTIFGLKSPGPRIWKERERLQNNYGYTDESLCLVQPYMVEKMMRYKATKEHEAANIARAAQTEVKEYIVPIKENTNVKKESWNPDDWLED